MSSTKHGLIYLQAREPEHPLGSIPVALTDYARYEREFRGDHTLSVTMGKDAIVATTLENLGNYLRTRNAAFGIRALSMMEMLSQHDVPNGGFEEIIIEIADTIVEQQPANFALYCEALSHPVVRRRIASHMSELALKRSRFFSSEPMRIHEAECLDTYEQVYDSLFAPLKGFHTREEFIDFQSSKFPELGLASQSH